MSVWACTGQPNKLRLMRFLSIRRREAFNRWRWQMASLKHQYKREWNALAWAIRWCTDPTHRNWPWYGGRGITVCPQWQNSFETFLNDVGPKPKHGKSRSIWLGRLDVNGNDEPGNVAWVPRQRQVTHRRYCRRIPFNGQELTLEEVARELRISADGLRARVVTNGMQPEKAISQLMRGHRKNSIFLTFNGETLSTVEWGKRAELNRSTIRRRIKRGMSLEKALHLGDLRKLSRPRQASSP